MSVFDRGHPSFLGLLAAATVSFIALLVFFWQAIFWAVVIGILFHPVQVRLVRAFGGYPSLSSVLTVVLIFFTVLVPALSLASAVALEATRLYGRIQSGEWDIGAAHAVLRAAGGEVYTFDGSVLPYNSKESLLNPEFVAVGDAGFAWFDVLPPVPAKEDAA